MRPYQLPSMDSSRPRLARKLALEFKTVGVITNTISKPCEAHHVDHVSNDRAIVVGRAMYVHFSAYVLFSSVS